MTSDSISINLGHVRMGRTWGCEPALTSTSQLLRGDLAQENSSLESNRGPLNAGIQEDAARNHPTEK